MTKEDSFEREKTGHWLLTDASREDLNHLVHGLMADIQD